MNVLKSEYLKFFYNKWLLLIALSTIILVPMLVIFLHETPDKINEDYVLTQIAESYYLGQSGMMLIAILYIGQEFIKSTLRSSLIAIPIRWKLIFSKLLVLLSAVVILWIVIVLFSIMVVKMYYGFRMVEAILTLSAKISFASISLILICSSLVTLTKSIVFSIGFSLSFLLGLGQMLLQFSTIFLYLPILSTMNMFLIVENPFYLYSPDGVIIQNLWAIGLLALSSWLFGRRGVR